jgi:hypothetical protein
MRQCEDESAFQWIRDNRTALIGKHDDPNWKGAPLSRVLPAMFPSYVKILHRLDSHYENIDNPLSSEELLILRIPECSSLRNLVELHRNRPSTRIRWKEVANWLGLAFESGIIDEWFRAVIEAGCWARFIYGPGDGRLDPEDGDALVRVLRNVTPPGDVYIRMAEVPLAATETPLLYSGSFEDVLTLLRAERSNMLPEYWWPRDQSWCVCSDYNLPFTLVGATHEVCQRLLEDAALECIEVTPETRIDFRSPLQLLR